MIKCEDKIKLLKDGKIIEIPSEEYTMEKHIGYTVLEIRYTLKINNNEMCFTSAEDRANFLNDFSNISDMEQTSFSKEESINLIYDLYYNSIDDLYEGLALVRLVYKGRYKGSYTMRYGYIDNKGNEHIPCIYYNAYPFQGGIAEVQNDDGLWGCIDKTGNVVTPFKYESAEEARANSDVLDGKNIFSDANTWKVTHIYEDKNQYSNYEWWRGKIFLKNLNGEFLRRKIEINEIDDLLKLKESSELNLFDPTELRDVQKNYKLNINGNIVCFDSEDAREEFISLLIEPLTLEESERRYVNKR